MMVDGTRPNQIGAFTIMSAFKVIVHLVEIDGLIGLDYVMMLTLERYKAYMNLRQGDVPCEGVSSRILFVNPFLTNLVMLNTLN